MYGSASELRATLEYDILQEKNFNYKGLSMDDIIHHLAIFISGLWQIHIFGEGNTRTTAVFFIKYVRTLGFSVTNDIFADNAWYFRNALVRANYNDLKKGIRENSVYLERFFRNLLLEEHNILKNRYLHINAETQSIRKPPAENTGRNLPVNLPVNKTQRMLLRLLLENPKYTYDELADRMDKTRETIRVNLRILENKNMIKRIGADKNGSWSITIP